MSTDPGTTSPAVTRELDAHGVSILIDGRSILSSVSLQAEHGELIGIIGPNGAGKTMLVRAISGLWPEVTGRVLLHGQDVSRLGAKEIARTVAHLPQSTILDFGFTCLEVVLMGRNPYLGPFQIEGAEDYSVASDAMAKTDTADLAQRQLSTLSGGERQRVLISRALAQQPRLLLLDEPTANLDIQHQLQVMELVRGLAQQGMTILAAMHDLSLAARFCDRLVLLHEGRVLADGSPEQVLTPANLEQAYGVRTLVYTDPVTDSLTVTALEPSQAGALAEVSRGVTHVIPGGGAGGRVMYMLKEAGYCVTAGVLGEGDSDYQTARMLDITCPRKPPFSPITRDLHEAHLGLVREADCVVLTEMWIGENNYLNLEAAASAENLVLIEEGPFEARDYTGGRAAKLYNRLRESGTVTSLSHMLEVVDRIVTGPDQSAKE